MCVIGHVRAAFTLEGVDHGSVFFLSLRWRAVKGVFEELKKHLSRQSRIPLSNDSARKSQHSALASQQRAPFVGPCT